MLRLMLLIVLLFTSAPAGAEVTLPPGLAKRILRSNSTVLRTGAEIILSYGQGGAIDAAGLARVVAIERARARATQRIAQADIDNDGSVTGAEMDLTLAALPSSLRGKAQLGFSAADADSSGIATAEEVAAFAQSSAEQSVPDRVVDDLLALLAFDGKGDGRLTTPELEARVPAFAAAERKDSGAAPGDSGRAL